MAEIQIYEDLSDISDSMLMDSDTLIAKYLDEEKDIYLTLEVRGEVNVDYMGQTYRNPSEFPEALVQMIQDDPMNLWYNEAVEVDANNWFEAFVWNDKECTKFVTSEVVDVENLSKEELKTFMEEYAQDIEKWRDEKDLERG